MALLAIWLLTLSLLVGCNRPDPPPTSTSTAVVTDDAVPTATATSTSPATAVSSSTPSMTPTLVSANPSNPSDSQSALEGAAVISPNSNASIRYLGPGGNRYEITIGAFLVKRNSPFRFEKELGPSYLARQNELVWQIIGDFPVTLYEETYSFGEQNADCEIIYVQIDDDVDNRRNRFFLNDVMIHEMPQGMVVNGRFVLPNSGELTLRADDSIGAQIEVSCPQNIVVTNTPTPTNTQMPTATITPTGSNPNPPTPTATSTIPVNLGTPTPTLTPSPTAVVGPAFTRFNFEMAGDVARDGYCYMHRDTGELLLIWQMQQGWTDSAAHPDADANGWLTVDIPHVSIYVEVFCDAGEGIVRMDIHNGVVHPQTGEVVGWLTRGIRNAIEIGWPDN